MRIIISNDHLYQNVADIALLHVVVNASET